jgi:hypothetical protein
MSWQDCIDEIRAAAGDQVKLADRDIERMLHQVIREAKRRSGIGAPTADTIRLAARDLADRERITAAIAKRNAQIDMLARTGRRQRIEANPDGIAGGIRAEIHGTATPTTGGRFSAEAEWKALNRQYREGIVVELEHAGLLAGARGRELERGWTRELFELSKGADGRPGASGSPEALKIAQIINKYQSLAKTNLNKAGAWIGDYAGYITRTSHDPDRIRQAGLAAWKDSIRDKLDERTFDYVGEKPEDREQFLDNVYHALITGVHLTHEGMQGFKDPGFSGPGNLAERLSHERVLHFRDADAWLDYHHEFGTGNMLNSVMATLDRSARATAIMHRFGTNPRAEFAGDLRYFAEENRNADPGAVVKLREAEKDLQNRFDFLDGTANIPVNRLGARVSSALRVVESMAKLGGVVFTHLPVGMTKAAELRYQGIGLLKGYGDYLQSFVRGRGAAGGETREIMDRLLAGHEGMLRDLLARFEPDDTIPGTLSKLANTFFKYSGLTYVLNAQRAGAEFVMSRHLGALLEHEHAALPPETQRILTMFGIERPHWELLRQAADHADIDGRKFLTPDAATRIPPAAAIGHLFDTGKVDARLLDANGMRAVDRFRDDLALRLHAYFNDRSEHVVIVPGIATKADILRGTRPGTPEGEALRFVAQFKTWPAALVRMALGREIYGGQSKPAAIAGILHMALAGTVLGYMAMSLKDLMKGRQPRDPLSPKTWAAAMIQGGGAGIFGDYLFGEYNRFGQNFSETLLGPVIGQGVNSALDLFNRLKQGQDLKAAAFQDLLNNTPFINLFYSRIALDYLFLWQVQEALNPGFLRRFEKRVKDQNHQNFWLSPTATVASHNAPRARSAPSRPWSWAQ